MNLFVDVDGVFNITNGPKSSDFGEGSSRGSKCMEPEIVDRFLRMLALLEMSGHNPQVIFNTAWNALGLRFIKRVIEERCTSNELYARCDGMFVGTTHCCSGGGFPVRDWIIANKQQGVPYVIIDDSTHNYNLMWCRFVQVDPSNGFTKENSGEVLDLANACRLPELGHRVVGYKKLMREALRLLTDTPWLTQEARGKFVEDHLNLAKEMLLYPNFAENAFLEKH